MITGTGGTLISNGITTVHTTRVFGTYNNGGDYAQIVQSTAKVFEDDFAAIAPTAAVTRGRAEPVTELPSIGEPIIAKIFLGSSSKVNTTVASFTGVVSQQNTRIKLAKTQKKTAINDFKERLKSRFQSFRNRVNSNQSPRRSFDTAASSTSTAAGGRGTVTQLQELKTSSTSSNRFRSRGFGRGR